MNIIICCIIIIQYLINVAYTNPEGNIANKYFLEKQKFIFEILQHVQEPLLNEELIKAGQIGLERDPEKYMEFNQIMVDFDKKIFKNRLLKPSQQFSMVNPESVKELKGMFYLLYYAKDWETLKQNICWARIHLHPEMFVFAFTQALMKREDFADLMLPKIHEIWPYHFLETRAIRKLETFSYDQWTWQSIWYSNCSKEQNERWCSGIKEAGIKKEEPQMLWPTQKKVNGYLRNSSKWFQALEDVSFYTLSPQHNEGRNHLRQTENSYLLLDKDWHSYWYYLNMGLWLHMELGNTLDKELRDWWFWNLQQILIRHRFSENKSTAVKRSSNYSLNERRILTYGPLESNKKLKVLQWLQDLYHTTQTALREQTFQGRNQSQLSLHSVKNFEEFLKQYFDTDYILKILWTSVTTEDHNFQTMLRDENFFDYAEIVVKLYKSLKSTFDPHKASDFNSEGLKINNVNITKLQTYFELIDSDVTNLLRPSHLYYGGQLLWFKSLMIRQYQLQHQPFTIWLNISAEKPQSVIVRSFLQLECSNKGGKTAVPKDYLHLDTFLSDLTKGSNIIERHSKEFYAYAEPSFSYTELYHFVQSALNDRFEFPLNISNGMCRFPHHLMLPQGIKGEGLPIKIVSIVSPYNYGIHKADNLKCDFSDGVTTFDDLLPGFPFDRYMKDDDFLHLKDNIFVKSVRIYHRDEIYNKEN